MRLFELYVFTSFALTTVSSHIYHSTPECYCGYGGLCLNDHDGSALETDCSLCVKISRGFYDQDCGTISNHCLSSPCKRGTCQRTVGGYFCRCPWGYAGQSCEVHDPHYAHLRLLSEVHVYYQVQPGRLGAQQFTVAFSPDVVLNLAQLSKKASVQIIIEMSTGTTFFPSFDNDFKMVNVEEKCLEESNEYPNVRDARICQYLPEGDLLAFSFSPRILLGSTKDALSLPDRQMVGLLGQVTVGVFIQHFKNYPTVLYQHTYSVFTYYYQRAPNNCFMPFYFNGCSPIKSISRKHVRQAKIEVSVYKKNVNCLGGFIIKTNWNKQSLSGYSNIESYVKTKHKTPQWLSSLRDDRPEVIELSEDRSRMLFEPMYFHIGFHMLEFVVTLRGDPPHIGGTTVFQMVGRCWIHVWPGPLLLHLKGGEYRSAYCHQPLYLNLASSNPSIPASELVFRISCNNSKDEECEPFLYDIPVIKKINTPCGDVYSFNIVATHEIFPWIEAFIVATINFTESYREVAIECHHNCQPVDPQSTAIWIADTTPYFPHPVEWKVLWKGRILAHHMRMVDSLKPLNTSRIIVANKWAFSGKVRIGDVQMTVTSGHRVSCTTYDVVDNVKNRLNDFTQDSSSSRYQFQVGEGTYEVSPETFVLRHYQVGLKTLTFYWESTDLTKLKFPSYVPALKICLVNGWLTTACSSHLYYREWSGRSRFTISELKGYLEGRGLQRFLSTVDVYLYRDLCNGSTPPTKFQWKLNLKFRVQLASILMKLDVEDLRTNEVEFILSILLKFFLTERGSHYEKLTHFNDEHIHNFENLSDWMLLRESSLVVLRKCFRVFPTAVKFIKWELFKIARNLGFRAWSLAHHATKAAYAWQAALNVSAEREYLYTELERMHSQNYVLLSHSLLYFLKMVADRTPLYFKMVTMGNDYVGMWTLKGSYDGILYHLDVDARNEPKRVNTLFFSKFTGQHTWRRNVEVILPPYQPQLAGRLLSLTAMLLKEKLYPLDATPSLILDLRDKTGSAIDKFENAEYHVALPTLESMYSPKMADGDELGAPSVIFRQKGGYHFQAYKVTLPSIYINFTMDFKTEVPVGYYKLKIDYDQVPTYDETHDELPMPCTLTNLESFKAHCSYLVDPPEENGDMDLLYMGIMFELTTPEPISIHFRTKEHVCQLKSVESEWSNSYLCKVYELFPSRKTFRTVWCACSHLGVIAAYRDDIRYVKALTGLNITKSPHVFSQWKYLIVAIVSIVLLFLPIMSIQIDKRRAKKECLSYLTDNYPNDENKYAVGVFTSNNLLAGTRATVAFKVVGTLSSSRVHVLNSVPKRTLTMGSDNWYVMTTRKPLGDAQHLYIWHNYRFLSYWKCALILFFDIDNGTWFSARVDRWFKCETFHTECRVLQVKLNSESIQLHKSLANVMLKELCNKHSLFSVFFLHQRSIYCLKEKTSVLMLKTTLVIFVTWLAHRVPALFNSLYWMQQQGEMTMMGLARTGLILFLLSLGSRMIAFPFMYSFRSCYSAKIFQKKCTAPQERLLSREGSRAHVSESVLKLSGIFDHGRKRWTLQERISKGRISKFSRAQSYGESRGSKWDYGSLFHSVTIRNRIWNNLKFTLLAPCQFLCVNIDTISLRSKIDRRQLISRVATFGFVVVIMIAAYIGVLLTDIYQDSPCYLKMSIKECVRQITCYFSLALLLDIFCWEPIIIFFSTLFMVYVLKTTNIEKYYWSAEGRVPVNPISISYKKYMEKATHRDYKPLTSYEIEIYQKRSLYKTIAFQLVYYLMLVGAVVFACSLAQDRNTSVIFRSSQSIKKEMTLGGPMILGREEAMQISEVIDLPTALTYATYYIAWTNRWYNNKRIVPNGHWALDRKFKALGSYRLFFLQISKNQSQNMYQPMKKYFPPAIGGLDEENQELGSFELNRFTYHFEDLEGATIRGSSGMTYPLKGQCAEIPTTSWNLFFTRYRHIVGSIGKDLATNKFEMRALIGSNNFVNIFAKIIVTVNLLIELLPSGVIKPTLDVSAFFINLDDESTAWSMCFLFAFVVCLVVFNVLAISERGVWRHLTSYGVLRLLILLASILLILSLARRVSIESKMSDDFLSHSTQYIDIHPIKKKRWEETGCLLMFLTLVLLEVGLSMKRLLGIDCLMKPFFRSVLPCCVLFTFVFALLYVLKTCFTQSDRIIFTLLMKETSKESPLNGSPEREVKMAMMFVIVGISVKFILGAMLLAYLDEGEDYDYETKAVKLIRRLIKKTVPPAAIPTNFKVTRREPDEPETPTEQAISEPEETPIEVPKTVPSQGKFNFLSSLKLAT